MRTLIVTALLAFGFTLSSSALMAQTGDGFTPAEESVCDPLKADGVSKGLYGLCIAYCEAEAQSEDVLDNYNRRRSEDDPDMPCVAAVVCPCWEGGIASYPDLTPDCDFNGGLSGEDDGATYLFNDIDFDSYGVGPSLDDPDIIECRQVFFTLSSGFIFESLPLDQGEEQGQEEACRQDIAEACQ